MAASGIDLEPVELRVHVDGHLDAVTERVRARKVTVPVEPPNIVELAEMG